MRNYLRNIIKDRLTNCKEWENNVEIYLTSKFNKDEDSSIELLVENLDFRMIEQLVKEQFSKHSEEPEICEELRKLQTLEDTATDRARISDQTNKIEAAPQAFPIEEKKVERSNNIH